MTATLTVAATSLAPGMVLALPFGRTSTIKSVKVGREYVNFTTEDGVKSRFFIGDTVLVERTAVALDTADDVTYTVTFTGTLLCYPDAVDRIAKAAARALLREGLSGVTVTYDPKS